jgi:hypothetical protein
VWIPRCPSLFQGQGRPVHRGAETRTRPAGDRRRAVPVRWRAHRRRSRQGLPRPVGERASGRAGPAAVRHNRPGREFFPRGGHGVARVPGGPRLVAHGAAPSSGRRGAAPGPRRLAARELAWTRYLLRLEPLASAPPEEVARWIGPTLDRYMCGSHFPLPESSQFDRAWW